MDETKNEKKRYGKKLDYIMVPKAERLVYFNTPPQAVKRNSGKYKDRQRKIKGREKKRKG